MNVTVDKDERTLAVENASHRWGYLVLSSGLLVLAMYRSLVRDEAPWDLMALVIIGGAVTNSYQAAHGVLTGRWVKLQAAAFIAAAVIAALIVVLRRFGA